ncbi:STN domain-containing protein, partial [Burkholderia gladioli]
MGVIVGIKLNGKGMARNVAAMAIAMAVAQTFMVSAADAQQAAQHTYHLPSGPLDRTLVEIAKVAHLPLSYDAALVQSLKSAPVDGTYSGEAAIRKALQGTGLDLVPTANGGYTLAHVKADVKAATAATAATAAATTVAGTSTAQVDTTLPLISVAASRDSGGTGFVAESSSTYARSDVPLS